MNDKLIKNYIEDLKQALDRIKIDSLNQIIHIIYEGIKNGKTIFMIGNGGSSATPSHSAGDFSKELNAKVMCLSDNIPSLTAWANDTDYSNIFVGQLKSFLSKGDIVMAYSGSGNSLNVVNGIKYAKDNGAVTIGFTGNYKDGKGGELAALSHYSIVFNSQSMERIEDSHLIINHIIKDSIKEILNENFID